MNITDKVCLITGGLGGIGYALTKEMLKRGLKGIVILDKDRVKSKLAKQLIAEFGCDRVLVLYTDVTSEAELKQSFKLTTNKFNQLDIVINSAIDLKDNWENMEKTNYTAPYTIYKMCAERYFPKYKSEEYGVVINISSASGLIPGNVYPACSVAKIALISMGRSLGTEYQYKKNKTKFLTICPGLVDTPLLKKYYTEESLMEPFKIFGWQTPEQLSRIIVHILGIFENGDVYCCQNGNYFKVKFKETYCPTMQNLNKLTCK